MKKMIMTSLLTLAFAGILNAETITVNAMGDTMMGSLYPTANLPSEDGWGAVKYVKKYMTYGNPDIVMLNMEGTITTHNITPKDTSRGTAYAFRSPVSYAKILAECGVTVANLANNHSYDFGATGYADTRKHLNAAGIKCTGGKGEILQMTVKGRKVGMIGFSVYDNANNMNHTQTAMALIKKAANENDIVILNVHAGAEGEGALHIMDKTEYYYGENRGNFMAFARMAIDNGADLIIGHGPHIVRAMQLYKDRLIAYSLGNFITYGFSTAGSKKYTLVLNVQMDETGKFLGGEIVPLIQNGLGIPYYDNEKGTIWLIQSLSEEDIAHNPLSISDSGKLGYK